MAPKKAKKVAKKKVVKKPVKKAKKVAKKPAKKKVVKKVAKKKVAKKKVAKKKAPKKVAKKKVAKKKAPRKPRKPNPAFMRPMTPSAALAAIVGAAALPRTEVTKRLWAYIKKNRLQDAVNRRMINADAPLFAIFGGKRQVSMFEMTKLVGKHLS